MTEHDILSDAEREALSEVMKAPAPVQPVQCVLIVEDDQFAWHPLHQGGQCSTSHSRVDDGKNHWLDPH